MHPRVNTSTPAAALAFVALTIVLPGCGEGDAAPRSAPADEARTRVADEALGELQQRYLTLTQHDRDLDGLLVRLHGFVSRHPDHAEARLLLGQALLTAGRAGPAYEALARAVELDPDRADWHRLAGTLAAKLRRHDRAEHHYRRAIALEPHSARARLLLAGVSARLERYDQAEALLGEALPIDSSLHKAHHTLAGVALARGRHVEARAHARRAVELVRGDGDEARGHRRSYKLMLARVLRADNRPADALDVLRSIEPARERAHPAVLEAEASCHAALGRPEAAARVYERLLIVRPTDLDLAEAAAKWHLEAGNLAAARDLRRHASRVDRAAPQTRRIVELIEAAEPRGSSNPRLTAPASP